MPRVQMPSFKLEILLVWAFCIPSAMSEYTPFLDPGFFFDFNKPGQPVPIPITEQCETIHITWGRSTARGANPVAPYFMQVFTSTLTTPFVIPVGDKLTFDWDVPFAPGTQYQICMFDKNGLTGGCQAMYTVIQNSTTPRPTCQNVTASAILEVQATVPGGPMSQYGFIDQCTDVTITPKSGKPPFILTVAPSLHPPYNITSDSMKPITWTVSLSWAFPFFISLSSADGQMWSNGPLHAGGFGPSDCLAPGSIPQKSATKMAVGAGIGSVVGGLAVGILGTYYLVRYRRGQVHTFPTSDQKMQPHQEDSEAGQSLPYLPSRPEGTASDSASSLSNSDTREFTITPYRTNTTAQYTTDTQKTHHRNPQGLASSTISSSWSGSPSDQPTIARSLTYVIHEDAGRASVSAEPNTENIIELPPRYTKNPKKHPELP